MADLTRAPALSPALPTALPTRAELRRAAPAAVSAVAMAVMVAVCASLQPDVLTVPGLSLVLSATVPLVIAAQAQMTLMSVGDIDLGIGAFVGLVTVIAATSLVSSPVTGALILLGLVAAYTVLGVLVHLRRVPSLIATLGASFVWMGLGLSVLPTPGGTTPAWLAAFGAWQPAGFPAPLLPILLVAALVYLLACRSGAGVRMRALGSNPVALQRAGLSPLAARAVAYTATGALGVLSGLVLASQTGGGDVSSASSYTLMTVAAVILGGGSFRGGAAVPWGVAIGGVTLGLVSVVLSLLDVPTALQSAVQGVIVLAVLAGRVVVGKVLR
ncbi:ABC transporter permease [Nonomuraea pusilla]|uniref:Monosaccharide ABC transporter membrane protein, CUT2 family (TC 3.A.1.2.-) n=1 Tax=Nonomuraea pusilla TaxID=46177 RepID=A0A1H8HL61_9ACTN|nr:ABC transporter permease [Nonomuraea pusilla]SEN56727.1 monosaccharide ABC transporter membrane protein, CUT2 family (TC 3.A.1.2.-) [Nonomuraea pusilla]